MGESVKDDAKGLILGKYSYSIRNVYFCKWKNTENIADVYFAK